MNRLIFFVDDDKMILHLLEYTFSGRDEYTVRSFRRGEDCLAALDQNPDLIILDHTYIGNNSQFTTGLDILREICKKNDTIDIFVLTANESEKLKEEYATLGVKKFITKNEFFIDNLIESIGSNFAAN
ncbi:MAG TPA: response regulator [Bacteroidales bacterium]|nr:response regulator [Bacteroidales bacterium]HOK99532.1 response regulator [Bacteroidales bacterium]HPO65057.1 response regulator [Bacteroidales bacterium]